MKKVLVIEDDANLCANVLELLNAEGFSPTAAHDGDTGIQLASSAAPDIIICDVTMFPTDGFAVLRAVRDNPQTRAIPFIFLTAKAARADHRAGITGGADDYLTKPFSRVELLDALKAQFDRQARVQPHQFDTDPAPHPDNQAGSNQATDLLVSSDTPLDPAHFSGLLPSPRQTLTLGSASPDPDNPEPPDPLPNAPNAAQHLIQEGFSKGLDILQRYRVTDLLGEGGFGVVLRAEQIATQQQVAIKVLIIENTNPAVRAQQYKRFRREVLLTGKLSNPHTVRLIDSGLVQAGQWLSWAAPPISPSALGALRNLPSEDTPIMVLEFVQGRTLRSILHQAPLSPSTAKRVISQVLESLVEAHSLGIVHRDLKPENIMVSGSGRLLSAKVLDFGISGLTDDHDPHNLPPSPSLQQITRQGEIRGTPSYMAPEQLFMFSQPRLETDLYAVGLILLECLTGEPAFSGSDSAVCIKQLHEQPHIPQTLWSLGFGAIIQQACQKDPALRFPSAEAMFAALDALPIFGDDLSSSKPTMPTFSPQSPLQTPSDSLPIKHTKSLFSLSVIALTLLTIVALVGFILFI